MLSKIIVRTQFVAMHKWDGAPEEVAFLRNLHRHVFHVEANIMVNHLDRELEFFMVKKELDSWIKELFPGTVGSCEMIAASLASSMAEEYGRDVAVSVFEDNENGAQVLATPKAKVNA